VPQTTCRRGAPFSPPNQLPTSNRTSNSQPNPTQPTAKPILSALWLIFLPLPEAFITPKQFNLHNSLATGGFLQTVVSDAPRTTTRTYLRSSNGAHPIQHQRLALPSGIMAAGRFAIDEIS